MQKKPTKRGVDPSTRLRQSGQAVRDVDKPKIRGLKDLGFLVFNLTPFPSDPLPAASLRCWQT